MMGDKDKEAIVPGTCIYRRTANTCVTVCSSLPHDNNHLSAGCSPAWQPTSSHSVVETVRKGNICRYSLPFEVEIPNLQRTFKIWQKGPLNP